MVNPKTVLIVQIGKIGDMILTTPLFREIKKLYPDSVLSVLASELNKIIAENDHNTDKVITYKKNFQSTFQLFFSSVKNQDVWIDTKNNYSRTSSILPKIFRPKLSLGFNFSKPVFDIDLKDYQTGNHATDINLSPLKYFTDKSYSQKERIPEIDIPDSIKLKTDQFIKKDSNSANIVINISAGDESRYLQKEKWAEIILGIGKRENIKIYLIGMDRDRDIIDYLLRTTDTLKVNYIKTENILETAEVIRNSNIVISPDTSIIHICSAYNIPVIGIYPDLKWNLEKFYPLSDKKEVVVSGNKDNIADVTSAQIIKSFECLFKSVS
ncbi:MAG: glycosyltransferase family 9 protein [Ignavibacteriae bacterium]|nr:glycosyltransferase family 9 protein [Ignavibacteriota bacterium]